MKYIIANFKSHKTLHEYEAWLDEFEAGNVPSTSRQVVLCPAFPSLLAFSSRLADDQLHAHTSLGVQDISPFPAGKYTGAVSVTNLEGFNIQYAIVGHSERRQYFHEKDQEIANKVDQCLRNDITPIVCVTAHEIEAQSNAISPDQRDKVIVAFEPLEHIGAGEADTLEHILEIKDRVIQAFGTVPYIYGGSVDPSTDTALLASPHVDGFLVGSASLECKRLLELLRLIH